MNQTLVACACGCGRIIKKYSERILPSGKVSVSPYRPRRFVKGHQSVKPDGQLKAGQWKNPKQAMICCACGCGAEIERFYKAGEYWLERKYVHNHHKRGVPATQKQKDVTRRVSKLYMANPANQARILEKRKHNPNWQKSVSHTAAIRKWDKRGRSPNRKYPPEWTHELRESIRARDGGICQMCGAKPKGKLSIHHIDFNKRNCVPANLISLCRPCHGKAHSSRRPIKPRAVKSRNNSLTTPQQHRLF